MSYRIFVALALIINAVAVLGQPPANLTQVATTSLAYSSISKIQVKLLQVSAITTRVCVGIQYQTDQFDALSGTYTNGASEISLFVDHSASSGVLDFSLMDKGSQVCDFVLLSSSGTLSYDGDTYSTVPGGYTVNPKKVAYTRTDYSNLFSDPVLVLMNSTGFIMVNKNTGNVLYSASVGSDTNTYSSVSVTSPLAGQYGVILGVEGILPPPSAQIFRYVRAWSTATTTIGARNPAFTSSTDAVTMYCYDNGISNKLSSKIYCGKQGLTNDVQVADGVGSSGTLSQVQVSSVSIGVVVVTAVITSTTPSFKLVTASDIDFTIFDDWNGYPILPGGLVTSHATNNLIGLAYTSPASDITFSLFKYNYSPPTPPVAPPVDPTIPAPPLASPGVAPVTPPVPEPIATPDGGGVVPANSGPVASPIGSTPSTISAPTTPSGTPSKAGGPTGFNAPVPSNGTADTAALVDANGNLTGNGIGMVVGLVAGGAALGVAVFLIVFFMKKKQRQQKKKGDDTEAGKGDNVPLTAVGEQTYLNIPANTNNKYSAMNMSASGPATDDGIVPANIQPSEIDKRLHIPHKSLVFVKEIGSGSYGKVYLGEWRGAKVAIKVNNTITDVDGFLAEAKLTLGIPPHPNLVQTFGVSLDGPNPCIVLEYCGGGSLDQLFKIENGLTNEKRLDYALKIGYGLLHLHSRSIVHRDLAARNILLTNDGSPKISDFGMSRIVQEEAAKGRTKTNVGPIRWMAPESLTDRSYSLKTDVWTYGVMLFEIVSGKEPHEEEDQFAIALKIRDQGFTPQIPDDCDPILRECMQMCWQKNPQERPSMEDVCDFLRSKIPSAQADN